MRLIVALPLLLSAAFAALAVVIRAPNRSVVAVVPTADSLTPALVAEGKISTPLDEFSGTFSRDGRQFYFGVSVPRSHHYVICYTTLRDGNWSTPSVAPFSGRYRDFDPMISPDGARLYFISDRPVNGRPKTDYDIWFMQREGDGWGEPQNAGSPINTDAQEVRAVAARDGSLYFTSTRPGGMGASDVYRARFVDGRFVDPVNLGPKINSASDEAEVIVSPDESFLVVAAFGRPDSHGSQDLYVSRRRGEDWEQLRNAGPVVNSYARDYSPSLTPDGRELVFTSERGGPRFETGRVWTYESLRQASSKVLSGWGNIYRVSVQALDAS